jgi:hypothetical protein
MPPEQEKFIQQYHYIYTIPICGKIISQLDLIENNYRDSITSDIKHLRFPVVWRKPCFLTGRTYFKFDLNELKETSQLLEDRI